MSPKLLWLVGCLGLAWACHPQMSVDIPPKESPAHDARPREARPEARPAPRGTTGAACERDDDCQLDFSCETRIPGGYCTRTCSSSTQCPKASACVRIDFKEGPSYYRCLRTCHKDVDCRKGFYCYHPPGAWKLICLPQIKK